MVEPLGEGLDLSILGKLNIPKIEGGPADEEGFERNTTQEEFTNTDENLPVIDTEDNEQDENSEESNEFEEPLVQNEVNTSEESVNKIWYEWAAEKGLVEPEEGEEFEDSEEFLLKKFNDRITKDVDLYKETLPEKIKQLINNWEEGVPLDALIDLESRQVEYGAITKEAIAENPELQKRLVGDWLYSQGFEEDEIPGEIEKYEQAMLLEDRALVAQKKLAKLAEVQKNQLIEQSKQNQKLAQEEYEAGIKNFEKTVLETKEIFPEVPLTDSQKKKIVELITKPAAKTADGRVINGLKKMELEDPNFLIKLAYMATLNWDITGITKKAAESAPSKLRKSVKTYQENKLSNANLKTIKSALSSFKRQNKF